MDFSCFVILLSINFISQYKNLNDAVKMTHILTTESKITGFHWKTKTKKHHSCACFKLQNYYYFHSGCKSTLKTYANRTVYYSNTSSNSKRKHFALESYLCIRVLLCFILCAHQYCVDTVYDFTFLSKNKFKKNINKPIAKHRGLYPLLTTPINFVTFYCTVVVV